MRLSVLLIMAMASFVDAAPPKVPGVVKVRVGEITSVEFESEAGKEVAWAPGFAPESCFVDEGKPLRKDTARLILSPKSEGVHRIIVWTVGEREYGTLIIDATGGVAPIPPTPKPPTPTPIPDGKFGLIKVSRDGLAGVAVDKRGQAIALAGVQRSHASAIAAGAFPSAAKILEGWRTANNGVVNGTDWASWGTLVSARLQKLYTDGLLKTNADWKEAFDEVATGLDGKP